MKTIRISEEVWQEIAKIGKFGETPDDVLMKVFNLVSEGKNAIRIKSRLRKSVRSMSSRIVDGHLNVRFYKGPSNKWILPDKNDVDGIRNIRKQINQFVEKNGGTIGQRNAAYKELTENGYLVSRSY